MNLIGRLPRIGGLLLLVLAIAAQGEEGGGFEWKGEAGLETRLFRPDHHAVTTDANLALAGRVEMDHRLSNTRERLRLFGRLDVTDNGRNLFDIQEAWAEYRWPMLEIRAGFDMLNWSATEAFHPADVINSRYLDSDIENPEKLGEPMLRLSLKIPAGELSAWYLPMFIAPIFPSKHSRQNPLDPGWRFEQPRWVDRNGQVSGGNFAHQWVVRLSQSRGPVDFDLHAIQYIDRQQPLYVADPTNKTVRPIYLPVTQIGGTMQAVLESWVVKLEWARRHFQSLGKQALQDLNVSADDEVYTVDRDHTQVAFGLEYNLAHDSGAVSTFVLEGQALSGVDKATRYDLQLFQRDLLVGYRYQFNDAAGSEFRSSFIFDVERPGERLFNLNYARRLTDTLGLRAGLRLFQAKQQGRTVEGLERFDKSDQVYLNLIYYF